MPHLTLICTPDTPRSVLKYCERQFETLDNEKFEGIFFGIAVREDVWVKSPDTATNCLRIEASEETSPADLATLANDFVELDREVFKPKVGTFIFKSAGHWVTPAELR